MYSPEVHRRVCSLLSVLKSDQLFPSGFTCSPRAPPNEGLAIVFSQVHIPPLAKVLVSPMDGLESLQLHGNLPSHRIEFRRYLPGEVSSVYRQITVVKLVVSEHVASRSCEPPISWVIACLAVPTADSSWRKHFIITLMRSIHMHLWFRALEENLYLFNVANTYFIRKDVVPAFRGRTAASFPSPPCISPAAFDVTEDATCNIEEVEPGILHAYLCLLPKRQYLSVRAVIFHVEFKTCRACSRVIFVEIIRPDPS